MRHRLALASLLASLLTLAPGARAQEPAARPAATVTLRVAVVDDSTGRPLERATVRLADRRGAWFTDRRGQAELRELPAAPATLLVSMPGYALRRLPLGAEGGSRALEVRLTPQLAEVMLQGLTVTSWGRSPVLRSRGFYDRQGSGGSAQFMTREQIENRHPRSLLDVFRGMRGWAIDPATGRTGQVVKSMRAQGMGLRMDGPAGGRCLPELYLDGIALARTEGSRVDDFDNISWETVEGIEAYPSAASVPSQFNSTGSSCGVILIWTR